MSEEKTYEMDKKEFEDMFNEKAQAREDSLVEKFEGRMKAVVDEAIAPVDNRLKGLEVKERTDDKLAGFKNFGEFAKAVMVATTQPHNTDNRLKAWIEKAAGDGSTVAEPSSMGVLVPTGFLPTIFQVPVTDYALRTKCTNAPITQGRSAEFTYLDGFDQSGGTVHGGILWYTAAEEEQMTETKPRVGQGKLYLNKLTGLFYGSDEILRFSRISIEPFINKGFKDGLNFKLDYSIINGTGAGEGKGILNSACKVAVTAETNQATDTVLAENISKMWSRMMSYAKSRCVWLINPDVEPELDKMSYALGTAGQLVYLPAGGLNDSPNGKLKGRPVIPCDHCSDLGDEGDIILADMEAMLFSEAGGVEAETSIHLKFDYAQSAFRFLYYYDHQPWMKTYFTPRNGNTRAPFVTIATR